MDIAMAKRLRRSYFPNSLLVTLAIGPTCEVWHVTRAVLYTSHGTHPTGVARDIFYGRSLAASLE